MSGRIFAAKFGTVFSDFRERREPILTR